MNYRYLLVFVCLVLQGFGQTRVDLQNQAKNVDFSSAVSTKPTRTGPSLPATCDVGEMFFLTTAPIGQNLHVCSGVNVWSIQGGPVSATTGDFADCRLSATGSTATVKAPCNYRIGSVVHKLENDVVAVLSGTSTNGIAYFYVSSAGRVIADEATAATLTCNVECTTATTGAFPADALRIGTATFSANSFTGGLVTDLRAVLSNTGIVPGIGVSIIRNPTSGTQEITVDSTIATKASVQASTYSTAVTSGSSNTYLCTLNPQPPGYADRMSLTLKFHQANSGPSSLNCNGLGAKSLLKLTRGLAQELSASDLRASTTYFLIYDNSLNTGTGAFLVLPIDWTEGPKTVNLNGQTGDAAATTVLASGHTAGTYRICAVVVTTTPGSGTMNVALSWRSPADSIDLNTVLLSADLSSKTESSACRLIRSTGSSAISLDPGNASSAVYDLQITSERIQ